MKPSSCLSLQSGLILLLLLPYIVGFTPNPSDSSATTIQIAVGKGSYARVLRDCSGNVHVEDIPFVDAGVAVDHYFSAFRVGAKAGILNDAPRVFTSSEITVTYINAIGTYINPNIGLNTKYFGLDFGGLFSSSRSRYSYGSTIYPTGLLRIGNLDSWYFSSSLANNLPLMTGGGFFDMGLGFHFEKPNSNLWLGVATGPYEGAVFSLKGDFPMSNKSILNLHGQVGFHETLEYGLSVGTKIIF